MELAENKYLRLINVKRYNHYRGSCPKSVDNGQGTKVLGQQTEGGWEGGGALSSINPLSVYELNCVCLTGSNVKSGEVGVLYPTKIAANHSRIFRRFQ